MLNISALAKTNPGIVSIGNYTPIIQSILDYDYFSGKAKPSILAIAETSKTKFRYFWGRQEILIAGYKTIADIPTDLRDEINLFINVLSARRVLQTTESILKSLPQIAGGSIFAENIPESHSLKITEMLKDKNSFIIGPSSVGLLIPGRLKLGAIGGVDEKQLTNPVLHEKGNIAVFSASGGMANELINIVAALGKRISFALSFGGDMFPVFSPKDAFLSAESDPNTSHIVYFGELGGYDEYELVDLIAQKKIKKPVIAYIAGRIADNFPTAPQFGHAKAMAKKQKESAREKTDALRGAGVITSTSFKEFISNIKKIRSKSKPTKTTVQPRDLTDRKRPIFASSIARETDTEIEVLGENLATLSQTHSFAYITASLLLGRKIISGELEEFTDICLKLLVDNGPLVSGAVTTIISARAGRDLVSSLATGLLTVGNRFGGAINGAAQNWIWGVENKIDPFEFVESFSQKGNYIPGIGHKKYRIDNPDPRVARLIDFSKKLPEKCYLSYAKKIEKITTSKKANLILNADGTIAAVLLDILSEKEKMSKEELKELVNIEFFNALFVISRSVGFTAHHLDQKRLDEGLFRLPKEEVSFIKR